MLNLIVHARHQNLLDQFFESLLPTIDERVTIYAVTEGLKLPDGVIRIDRTEFRPGKYFNIVLKKLAGKDGYIGIINDDILFSKGWLDDTLDKLKYSVCISPGFIETKNHDYFLKRVEETKSFEGVEEGMHDAFFCFPIWLAEKLGGFDEDAVWWYDMSWYLIVVNAGYKWITSKKVTIQHLGRGSLRLDELPVKKIYAEIWKKWGRKNHLKWKYNSINLRAKFNIYE